MDPRHPELALPRVKELVKQYEDVEKRISKATVSSDLAQLEREGVLVVQELCLVAPRLHETLMNTSSNRRTELMSGINFGYVPEEKVGEYTKATIGIEDKPTVKENKTVEERPAKKKPAKKGKK